MTTHPFTVARTARYCTSGAEAGQAEEWWLALHGHAQLASRFIRQLEPLEDGRTRIVAPEALSRFYLETTREGRHGPAIGACWMTREDREAEIADILGYLNRIDALIQSEAGGRRGVRVLLGFSQGATIAARWLLRGASLPDRAVLWGAPVPDDVPLEDLARRLGPRSLLLVAGLEDPVIPSGMLEQQAAELERLGVSARAVRFPGRHEMPPDALRRVAGRAATG